ncbi:MAG TPA: flagellar export protein FliJ [Tepidisphaeraceae bacterium]|jgi:flagellar FliJ protein|nr:flagellar export protein FliJ [Tepidisphaeraceae bacterium]
MPKFVFPLDGVLRHRGHVEQEKQRDLARLQNDMRQAQDALRQLNQTVQGNVNDVRENRLLGRLDLGFLAAHRRYMAAVQRRGMAMVQRMSLLQREIDQAQKALAEAAKQKKIMEKLREKQRDRWSADLARKEAADLDEVSMRMVAWQGSTEGTDQGPLAPT